MQEKESWQREMATEWDLHLEEMADYPQVWKARDVLMKYCEKYKDCKGCFYKGLSTCPYDVAEEITSMYEIAIAKYEYENGV